MMSIPPFAVVFARAAKPLLAAVIAISAVSAAHGSVGVLIDPFQTADGNGKFGDGDEQKLFNDKNGSSPVSSGFGSLEKNNNTSQNINFSATGGTNGADFTYGSGFANIKSENQGDKPKTNTLTAFTFIPGPDKLPFNQFDGVFIRGQLDSENGSSTATITATINFHDIMTNTDGTTTLTFLDVAANGKDFGRIGFDEDVTSHPYDVTSVTFSLLPGAAAWNQIKQVDFSVPGTVTPVPEAPGLVMVLLAICGGVSLYGMQRIRRSAPNAS